MKLVIFGLSISSSWGNGHATLWRGIVRSLVNRGHRVVFYERDVPYYAAHRDYADTTPPVLRLFGAWDEVVDDARRQLADADAAIVTSYCVDGVEACKLVFDAPTPVRVFYDLDTPVTLARLAAGEGVPYLPEGGLGGFDLVLSYTGGRALEELVKRLGAKRALPLYGSVDPDVHRPSHPRAHYRSDLSYLGTFAEDRQEGVERLLLGVARQRPTRRFLIGGSQYPLEFPWEPNVFYVNHVPPPDHGAFYASSPLTLNVTRGPMAAMGYCPSGRLFEAAACGVPALSDGWEGLERFFVPGSEILVAHSTEEALQALDLGPEALRIIGQRARERVMDEHTAEHRAAELLDVLYGAGRRAAASGS